MTMQQQTLQIRQVLRRSSRFMIRSSALSMLIYTICTTLQMLIMVALLLLLQNTANVVVVGFSSYYLNNVNNNNICTRFDLISVPTNENGIILLKQKLQNQKNRICNPIMPSSAMLIHSARMMQQQEQRDDTDVEYSCSSSSLNRRNALIRSSAMILPILTSLHSNYEPSNAASTTSITTTNDVMNDSSSLLPVIKTSSGLKYIDLIAGTGISPSYGNLCSISYSAYIKLPTNTKNYSTKPQLYDTCNSYLIKHGNGRIISGLDEGLHTMKVGGTRRILIPPKLGYVSTGLGPLPSSPYNRYQLNNLLDTMIELSSGTIIYEVTLKSVISDEADLGYYSDTSLSVNDFNTLRENLRIKGNEGRKTEEQLLEEAAASNTIKGQDRLL